MALGIAPGLVIPAHTLNQSISLTRSEGQGRLPGGDDILAETTSVGWNGLDEETSLPLLGEFQLFPLTCIPHTVQKGSIFPAVANSHAFTI